MVARQQTVKGGKTSCGLQTDWFINSRLSGSSRKVTVIKNLIHKHQSGFERGEYDKMRHFPIAEKSQQNQRGWAKSDSWMKKVDFCFNRTSWFLLWQCTLEKQKKPWHPAKTNDNMTIWVTRLSLHQPVAEWTAPYIIIAKGSLSVETH